MFIRRLKSIKECKKECHKSLILMNKLMKLENDKSIFIFSNLLIIKKIKNILKRFKDK